MSKIRKISTVAIGRGINVLISLAFLPYMARAFDYLDYGSYGQTILVVAFAQVLLGIGLDQIIFVNLSEAWRNKKKVLSTNVLASLCLGAIGLVLLYLFAGKIGVQFQNRQLPELITVYAVSLLFTLPYQSLNAFLIYQGEVLKSTLTVVLGNIFKIVLVVATIQLFESVFLAICALAVSHIFQFLLAMYYTRNHLTGDIDRKLFTSQITSGFPLGLTGVIGMAILYIDGFMVSKMEGVKRYAIYRNGALEVPFVSTLYISISAIVLPEIAKLYQNAELKEILRLKRKALMNTIMIVYPVLIFLLFNSRDMIVLYLGEMYEASAIIFFVYSLTLIVRVMDYSDILVSSSNGKLILYYYTALFICNAILNYVLIQWVGEVGAAISTVFCLFILALIQTRKSLQIINAKFSDLINFKDLGLLLLVCLSLAFSLEFALSFMLKGALKILVFSMLFFSITYLFLIKKGMFSRDIIERLMPKKLMKIINKI